MLSTSKLECSIIFPIISKCVKSTPLRVLSVQIFFCVWKCDETASVLMQHFKKKSWTSLGNVSIYFLRKRPSKLFSTLNACEDGRHCSLWSYNSLVDPQSGWGHQQKQVTSAFCNCIGTSLIPLTRDQLHSHACSYHSKKEKILCAWLVNWWREMCWLLINSRKFISEAKWNERECCRSPNK